MRDFLLLLHLAGVIVWLGGMFFTNFCLRPIAAEQLPPPQRLPLLAAVLGRFFTAVALGIAAILFSGFVRLAQQGFAQAPLHWHAMAGLGLLMTAIFGLIAVRHYPRLRAAVAAADWPAAGGAMNSIRRWVAVNLSLGVLTLLVATLGSRLGG